MASITLLLLMMTSSMIIRMDAGSITNYIEFCNAMDSCTVAPPLFTGYGVTQSICTTFEMCAAVHGSVDIRDFQNFSIFNKGMTYTTKGVCELFTDCLAASMASDTNLYPSICSYLDHRCEGIRNTSGDNTWLNNDNETTVHVDHEWKETSACFWSDRCNISTTGNDTKEATSSPHSCNVPTTETEGSDTTELVATPASPASIYQDKCLLSLCPYTPFCEMNASRSMLQGYRNRDAFSCCSSCSCAPECAERRDCCFPNTDVSHKEKEGLQCRAIRMGYGLTKFDMVALCRDGKKCDLSAILFNPVSSASRQRIYINENCALCNGVKDSTHWPSKVYCMLPKNFVLISLLQFYSESACMNYFHLPSTMHGLNFELRFICSKGIIRRCPNDFKDQRVIELCGAIWAPILQQDRKKRRYQTFTNPYCALCHSHSTTDRCFPTYDDVPNKNIPPCKTGRNKCNGPIAFLNYSVIHNISNEGSNCTNTGMICRPVLCPDGTVRVGDECQHYLAEMKFVQVRLQLKLMPLPDMSISLNPNLNRTFCVDNGCPWRQDHAKLYVSFRQTETRHLVDSIILQIDSYFDSLNPANDFAELERCLQKEWIIRNGHVSYSVQPTIDKYRTFVQDGKSKRTHAVKVNGKRGVFEDTALTKRYELLTPSCSVTPTVRAANIYLSKLYFCEQVELYSDEIIPLFGEIKLKHNKVILGDNEFAIDYRKTSANTNQNDTYTVRVCLEEFNKQKDEATVTDPVSTVSSSRSPRHGDPTSTDTTLNVTDHMPASTSPLEDHQDLTTDTILNVTHHMPISASPLVSFFTFGETITITTFFIACTK